MFRTLSLIIATACLVLATSVVAVPSPKAVPARPELSFTPGDLRIFRSNEDGRWYWYFTYGVENNTGIDQIWIPDMVLYTDQGEILKAGQGVSSLVTDEIVEYIGDPLLEPQYAIIGDLKQGRGNAKNGLSVWPARQMEVNELALFVAGMSSETLEVEHPLTKAPVVLKKTLKREYLIPGAANTRGDRPVELHPDSPQREVWIFR
ncbi:MAG: hypothetical protein CMJ29_08180 [Phycisphaerae bacterium]|nr:hypothetical protein [Phycisphaerae bacterium]|tara:strand:- start:133 stop:747 length:615 start_codon:yes stop_codon:yes gene_type:complete